MSCIDSSAARDICGNGATSTPIDVISPSFHSSIVYPTRRHCSVSYSYMMSSSPLPFLVLPLCPAIYSLPCPTTSLNFLYIRYHLVACFLLLHYPHFIVLIVPQNPISIFITCLILSIPAIVLLTSALHSKIPTRLICILIKSLSYRWFYSPVLNTAYHWTFQNICGTCVPPYFS